jgi:hypothetical protein
MTPKWKNIARFALVAFLVAISIDDITKHHVVTGIAGIVVASILSLMYWSTSKSSAE